MTGRPCRNNIEGRALQPTAHQLGLECIGDMELAEALGAAAAECGVPEPLPGVRAVARVQGDGEAGRTSLAGVDPVNAARILDQTLENDEKVLIVLKPMTKRQRRRWRAYAENMPGSTEHHSLKAATPLFATVMVTAADATDRDRKSVV